MVEFVEKDNYTLVYHDLEDICHICGRKIRICECGWGKGKIPTILPKPK